MSSGRRNKKSKSKLCKESYSIKRRQQERAFQAHYPKAAASGGGSLLVRIHGWIVDARITSPWISQSKK
jgi:hypothetical protein